MTRQTLYIPVRRLYYLYSVAWPVLQFFYISYIQKELWKTRWDSFVSGINEISHRHIGMLCKLLIDALYSNGSFVINGKWSKSYNRCISHTDVCGSICTIVRSISLFLLYLVRSGTEPQITLHGGTFLKHFIPMIRFYKFSKLNNSNRY